VAAVGDPRLGPAVAKQTAAISLADRCPFLVSIKIYLPFQYDKQLFV
jgi:hypothetical protein